MGTKMSYLLSLCMFPEIEDSGKTDHQGRLVKISTDFQSIKGLNAAVSVEDTMRVLLSGGVIDIGLTSTKPSVGNNYCGTKRVLSLSTS